MNDVANWGSVCALRENMCGLGDKLWASNHGKEGPTCSRERIPGLSGLE